MKKSNRTQSEIDYLGTYDAMAVHNDLCRLEMILHRANASFRKFVVQGMRERGELPERQEFRVMERRYRSVREALGGYVKALEGGVKDMEDSCRWIAASDDLDCCVAV